RVSERDAGRLQGLLEGGRLVRLVLETIVSKRIALEPALHLHAPHYGMGPESIRVEGLARTHLFGDIRDRDELIRRPLQEFVDLGFFISHKQQHPAINVCHRSGSQVPGTQTGSRTFGLLRSAFNGSTALVHLSICRPASTQAWTPSQGQTAARPLVSLRSNRFCRWRRLSIEVLAREMPNPCDSADLCS